MIVSAPVTVTLRGATDSVLTPYSYVAPTGWVVMEREEEEAVVPYTIIWIYEPLPLDVIVYKDA